MFTKLAGALGQSLINAMSGPSKTDTPLVQMFRVEYGKEYLYARKNGVTVNNKFVKEFLANAS